MSNVPARLTRRLLTRVEAAEYVGLSVTGLDQLVARGEGPRRIKFGDARQSAVKFDLRDLDDWIDSHRVDS